MPPSMIRAARLAAVAAAAYAPFAVLHGWALLPVAPGRGLLAPALAITALGPLLVAWEWDFVLGFARAAGWGWTAVPALALAGLVLVAAPAAGVRAWRRASAGRLAAWAVCLLLWFAVGLGMWVALWMAMAGV